MRKTVLFIGKFMPFHKGHESAIRKLLKKYNVVVVIGSIDKKQFTFTKRKKMIEKCFGRKLKVIGVADTKSDEEWVKKIKKRVRFDFVVTGNPWVARCFRGFDVRKHAFLRKKSYHGRVIRKRIREGKKWKQLVPKKVIELIKKD